MTLSPRTRGANLGAGGIANVAHRQFAVRDTVLRPGCPCADR